MGQYIYGEWLTPVWDYYRTLKRNEGTFEIGIPFVIAVVVAVVYSSIDSVLPALLKLRDILPAALAILIGFTITCITTLIASNNKNIESIKEVKTRRILGGQELSIYQWMLIMFIYALIVQIVLLILVFFVAFILRICINKYFINSLLAAEVFLMLHVLLLLTRNITNFYFVFFRKLQ